MLARERTRGQGQEQRSEPDRADLSAMNLHRWLAPLFVLLVLGGCAQASSGQGQAPDTLYPPEFDRHTHGGVDM